eukprot:TRINITY_DN21601_c0_g1_i1.p1 TRINITY_DN21601_c0_g1~~TRINITY_DN21601_c0_g1_i1.p1  ORF type:complete len:283 (+),score=94.09 TRINITY_DN21601_c0_g1_i1:195-1043(+)
MVLSRDGLFQSALVAESGGRYRDMADIMLEIADMDIGLREVERHAIAIAYSKLLGESISRMRRLDELLAGEGLDEEVARSLRTLRDSTTSALWNDCCDITEVIVNHLIPSATSSSGEVFYRKWHSDTLRCAAAHIRSQSPQDAEELNAAAKSCYDTAFSQGQLALPPTSSTRLALVLNYATFLADVYGESDTAYDLAMTAVEDAASEWPALQRLRGPKESKAALLLHLLHQNAAAWKGVAHPGAAEGGAVDSDTNDPDNESLESQEDSSAAHWGHPQHGEGG